MSIQLLLEDADKWYKHYSWLNRSKRNEFLKETFSYPLSEEFVKEIDIVDVLITHLIHLETERQYAIMIELYDAIIPQKQVFDNDFFYVDDYFIDYYLFKHDPDGVKKHLISFKEYPIKAIDSLTNVFSKLIFYNYTDIALDVAMKIYPEIFHASELMPDAELDYARFIYMEKIQEIHQTLIIGGVINKPEIKKYVKKYGFVIKDEIDIIESVLADDFSDYPDIADFYKNKSRFMFKILLLFLRYMYQEKNVSFPAAASIWFEAMDFLINEDQTDSQADFAEIFALDPELYSGEIYKRFDFLSINTASAVALAWGMSYIYDFLKKYDYISNSVHNSAMKHILSVQAEIIKARADELWKYNYLHQWVKPDSVEEKDFIKEKEDFEYTFSNIIKTVKQPYSSLSSLKVTKRVPINVVKIGRNDPCPCGSGKKYKKCCELSEGRLFE
jgi:uncharacterized protein YchJ